MLLQACRHKDLNETFYRSGLKGKFRRMCLGRTPRLFPFAEFALFGKCVGSPAPTTHSCRLVMPKYSVCHAPMLSRARQPVGMQI